MSDLKKLYQDVILKHSKNPRNFGIMEPCTHHGHGDNPLCGDKIDIFLTLDDSDHIEGIKFNGKGCAITIASASLMTEILKGKTTAAAQILFDQFEGFVSEGNEIANADADTEVLSVLSGVRQFPTRIKCATLPWHAFNSALQNSTIVTTEKV